MTETGRKEVWDSGKAYEPYVGRWSRLVAREFLSWLSIPRNGEWLDVGCGTGALTRSILDHASPKRVVGIDPSEGFVAHASHEIADVRASFRVGDAQALSVDDNEFDSSVAGLVINFVPDQARAVAEMRRAVRPGGTVGAYVWDYAGEMQMMRRFWDAAVELNPAARDLDEGRRFPICHPGPLKRLFASVGLREIAVEAIDVPTVFRDFDDYWSPFLGGQAPAPGYCIALPERDRTALRDRIIRNLPIRVDGSIHLIARAWAVRGCK